MRITPYGLPIPGSGIPLPWLNLSDTPSKITVDLEKLDRFSRLDLMGETDKLRNVFDQCSLELENGCATVTVRPHGVVVLEK